MSSFRTAASRRPALPIATRAVVVTVLSFFTSDDLRIKHDLEPVYSVQVCHTTTGLIGRVRREHSDLMMVGLQEHRGRSAAPFIARLRASFPSIPIIAYGDAQTRADILHLIPRAMHAGAEATVILDHDDVVSVVEKVLASHQHPVFISQFEQDLCRIRSRCAESFCRYVSDNAEHPLAVGDVVQHLAVSRQHVASEFRTLQMGTPSDFIAWVRLLYAAQTLQDPRLRIGDIASRFGWETTGALRRSLIRNTPFNMQTVRTPAIALYIADVIRAILRGAGQP